MSKFLNTGVASLETINTKLRNELVDSLHLLTDRVNEKSVSSGHDTKRNTREATTRANVKKGGGNLKTDVLAGQRKKRVNNMKRHGRGRVNDPREIDDLVLLYEQLKVTNELSGLVLRTVNAKRSELVHDLSNKGQSILAERRHRKLRSDNDKKSRVKRNWQKKREAAVATSLIG